LISVRKNIAPTIILVILRKKEWTVIGLQEKRKVLKASLYCNHHLYSETILNSTYSLQRKDA